MSRRMWILGPALLAALATSNAHAQYSQRARSGGRGGQAGGAPQQQGTLRSGLDRLAGMRQSPKFVSSSTTKRNKTATYNQNFYSGVITRLDQVRSVMPSRRDYASKYELRPLNPSPIQQMLDQRNLLSVRSPLARKTTSTIGHNAFTKDEAGTMVGDYGRVEKIAASPTSRPIDPLRVNDGKIQDAIEQRLSAQSDEYFRTGATAFTKNQYIQARNYFSLVRELEPDSTRSYLANTFVLAQKTEYGGAFMSFSSAVALAKTLDDLRIERNLFFKTPEDFKRRLELVNLHAQRNSTAPAISGVLAYYAFINGDVGTAIDAATNAEKNLGNNEGGREAVKKFKDMMVQQRTTSRPAP